MSTELRELIDKFSVDDILAELDIDDVNRFVFDEQEGDFYEYIQGHQDAAVDNFIEDLDTDTLIKHIIDPKWDDEVKEYVFDHWGDDYYEERLEEAVNSNPKEITSMLDTELSADDYVSCCLEWVTLGEFIDEGMGLYTKEDIAEFADLIVSELEEQSS